MKRSDMAEGGALHRPLHRFAVRRRSTAIGTRAIKPPRKRGRKGVHIPQALWIRSRAAETPDSE